jgi:hypothetical protein
MVRDRALCHFVFQHTKIQEEELNFSKKVFWSQACDIYQWGDGRAVNGQIRDIGQNVLQSFQTGSICSPTYCHLLYRTAFLEETLIRNTIIIL